MGTARKPTNPAGPVRDGFVVGIAPEYDIRSVRALQKKRYIPKIPRLPEALQDQGKACDVKAEGV